MLRRFFILVAALLALCGCRHKDLCYLHPHTAPVVINVDWSNFVHKETPSGMTVILYAVGGASEGNAPKTILSNNISQVRTELPEGLYNSIVFNQSVTEFGTLTFRNLDNYTKAEVALEQAPTKWYTKGDEEIIGFEPDWFGTDRYENAEVTNRMILDCETHSQQVRRSTLEYEIVNHVTYNVIYTLNISVKIKNAYNLKAARAALQGMAEGYLLGAGKANNTKATHLLESWELETDSTDPTIGYIKAKLMCFGLPGNHTAKANENKFDLNLLLVDNKTQVNYQFNVGDLFVKGTDPKELELFLSLEIDEPLPDVEPTGGSAGGFDATVEEWGEEEDHDIDI